MQGLSAQNFFRYRIVNLWSSLPGSVVYAPSMNCFKSRFDTHYSTEVFIYFINYYSEDQSTDLWPIHTTEEDYDTI